MSNDLTTSLRPTVSIDSDDNINDGNGDDTNDASSSSSSSISSTHSLHVPLPSFNAVTNSDDSEVKRSDDFMSNQLRVDVVE
jgi:hypothetical protein